MNDPKDIPVEFGDAFCGVLKTIQEAIDYAEHGDSLLHGIESLQEASLDDQAVFVVRLLLNYLDEDRRAEALKGFK